MGVLLMLGLTRRARQDPAADDTALDTPAYLRRHSLVSPARERALEWSVAPPVKPGWYFVRRLGQRDYEPYRVEADYEYPQGFEWAGPLQCPRDAA